MSNVLTTLEQQVQVVTVFVAGHLTSYACNCDKSRNELLDQFSESWSEYHNADGRLAVTDMKHERYV